jgi:hypothetical protein
VIAILFLCGTSVSCIRRETSIPQINGTVSDGDVRLAGAKVSFQVHGYSEDRTKKTVVDSATTTTNHEGAFSILRTTKLGVFLPVPADYAIPVSLCFEPESAPQVCWQVELLGPPELPAQLNVSCDVQDENICTFLDTKPIAYRVFRDP